MAQLKNKFLAGIQFDTDEQGRLKIYSDEQMQQFQSQREAIQKIERANQLKLEIQTETNNLLAQYAKEKQGFETKAKIGKVAQFVADPRMWAKGVWEVGKMVTENPRDVFIGAPRGALQSKEATKLYEQSAALNNEATRLAQTDKAKSEELLRQSQELYKTAQEKYGKAVSNLGELTTGKQIAAKSALAGLDIGSFLPVGGAIKGGVAATQATSKLATKVPAAIQTTKLTGRANLLSNALGLGDIYQGTQVAIKQGLGEATEQTLRGQAARAAIQGPVYGTLEVLADEEQEDTLGNIVKSSFINGITASGLTLGFGWAGRALVSKVAPKTGTMPTPTSPDTGFPQRTRAEEIKRIQGIEADFLARTAEPTQVAMPEAVSSIQQAKAEGKTFDDWIKEQGETFYHGSNKKFDKFDTKKYGTGEGSDLFGKGAYLTNNKDLADFYAKTVSKKSFIDSYTMSGPLGTENPVYMPNADTLAAKKAVVNEFIANKLNIYDVSTQKVDDGLINVFVKNLKSIGMSKSDAIKEVNSKLEYARKNAESIKNYRGELDYLIKQIPQTGELVSTELKKRGYDGLSYVSDTSYEGAGGKNYVIYNPDKLKSRSQLKAEWDAVQTNIEPTPTQDPIKQSLGAFDPETTIPMLDLTKTVKGNNIDFNPDSALSVNSARKVVDDLALLNGKQVGGKSLQIDKNDPKYQEIYNNQIKPLIDRINAVDEVVEAPSVKVDPLIAEARKYKSVEEFIKEKSRIEPNRKINNLVESYANGEKSVNKINELLLSVNAQENPAQFDKLQKEIDLIEEGNRYAIRQLEEETGLDLTALIEGISTYIDAGKRTGSPTMEDFYKYATRNENELVDIWNKAQTVDEVAPVEVGDVSVAKKEKQSTEYKLKYNASNEQKELLSQYLNEKAKILFGEENIQLKKVKKEIAKKYFDTNPPSVVENKFKTFKEWYKNIDTNIFTNDIDERWNIYRGKRYDTFNELERAKESRYKEIVEKENPEDVEELINAYLDISRDVRRLEKPDPYNAGPNLSPKEIAFVKKIDKEVYKGNTLSELLSKEVGKKIETSEDLEKLSKKLGKEKVQELVDRFSKEASDKIDNAWQKFYKKNYKTSVEPQPQVNKIPAEEVELEVNKIYNTLENEGFNIVPEKVVDTPAIDAVDDKLAKGDQPTAQEMDASMKELADTTGDPEVKAGVQQELNDRVKKSRFFERVKSANPEAIDPNASVFYEASRRAEDEKFADNLVINDFDKALEIASDINTKANPTGRDNLVVQKTIKKLIELGRNDEVNNITGNLSYKLTKSGDFIAATANSTIADPVSVILKQTQIRQSKFSKEIQTEVAKVKEQLNNVVIDKDAIIEILDNITCR